MVYFPQTCLLFSDIFSWMPLLCGEFPLWQTVGLPRWQLAQWHTFTLSVTQHGSLPLNKHTYLFICLKFYTKILFVCPTLSPQNSGRHPLCRNRIALVCFVNFYLYSVFTACLNRWMNRWCYGNFTKSKWLCYMLCVIHTKIGEHLTYAFFSIAWINYSIYFRIL